MHSPLSFHTFFTPKLGRVVPKQKISIRSSQNQQHRGYVKMAEKMGFIGFEWLARLGLNQRPLPCQGSRFDCLFIRDFKYKHSTSFRFSHLIHPVHA